jgi:hypothetical protein
MVEFKRRVAVSEILSVEVCDGLPHDVNNASKFDKGLGC